MEFLWVFLLALVVSALVALIAIKKSLGYGKAFLLCLALTIVLILARLPFPVWIAAFISAVTFIVWPKRDMSIEAKN
jgi:hypothetical protein